MERDLSYLVDLHRDKITEWTEEEFVRLPDGRLALKSTSEWAQEDVWDELYEEEEK